MIDKAKNKHNNYASSVHVHVFDFHLLATTLTLDRHVLIQAKNLKFVNREFKNGCHLEIIGKKYSHD